MSNKLKDLESRAFVEEREQQGKQKHARTLAEKVKSLPPAVRAEYKRAKKLDLMPEDAALRAVRKKLRAENEAALREELGHKHLHPTYKKANAERLEVTTGQVLNELSRMAHLVITVESGLDLD